MSRNSQQIPLATSGGGSYRAGQLHNVYRVVQYKALMQIQDSKHTYVYNEPDRV